MWEAALQALKRDERSMGMGFGDPERPLLVSVRSGARASMPGMMDTVLNVGLTMKTVEGLAAKTRNDRFAQDSYRRFVSMFGSIVMGVPREHFEAILKHKKTEVGVAHETHLDARHLRELVASFKALVKEETKKDFPDEPLDQLRMAINAVFSSWFGARAITYRRLYGIPDSWGTAVNVVAMVFGNMGETSGTGVAFTRSPSSGDKSFFGECLMNAQGEDVVAGIRTPLPVSALAKNVPEAYKELEHTYKKLEKHYRDMLDLEFTIQEGKLYMLQTRVGKRTGIAAVKIAVDMVKEGLISKAEAVQRIGPDQLAQYLYPIFDMKEESKSNPLGKGLPAGPGAAAGKIALTPDRAVTMKAAGTRVILVRQETSPDDIHGMNAAAGFLTARGGMTSHAAVVARQMGKVCVAGCESIDVDEATSRFAAGGRVIREGDFISLNGSTGEVILGEVPLIAPKMTGAFGTLMSWADAIRRLKVRANADTPRDASTARGFGAEGIGLCRTEHMFFAEDRIPLMREMILARSREDREKALEKLLPMQRDDFKGLYRAMKGYPVTIRLLDPPLHEFLPKREELMVEVTKLELIHADKSIIEEKKRLLERVEELHEFNPMLGLRGCRLGIYYPEI